MSLSSIHKWLLTELHFCRSTQAIIVIGEFMIAMAMLCSKNSILHPSPYILAPIVFISSFLKLTGLI